MICGLRVVDLGEPVRQQSAILTINRAGEADRACHKANGIAPRLESELVSPLANVEDTEMTTMRALTSEMTERWVLGSG